MILAVATAMTLMFILFHCLVEIRWRREYGKGIGIGPGR